MLDYAYARDRMVGRQIESRGVHDERVLRALREVPREAFVPDGMQEFAYDDTPLPIEAGQTISQPYIVARMIEAAELEPEDRVLEIGAGSGYSAAVLSCMARHVYSIERHAALARSATDRLHRLGYSNVEIRIGDGTLGWPEAAPFHAILAAAGGPSVPETLKAQLAPGGRLVIPVGRTQREQRLIKLTRESDGSFTEEDLGGVRFVPLIGAYAWTETGETARPCERPLPDLMREAAEPLPELNDPSFAAHFDRFAQARVVLLGECSHGTAEFYRARDRITRRLIERHGFRIVAVEADWPDAASIDRYVRQRATPAQDEPPFQRFPTWMWRNAEFSAFLRWLHEWNAARKPEARAGFYGLDLYNMSGSIRAVLDYLDRVDAEAAIVARERYGCLTPWAREPQTYGRMARSAGFGRCEKAVVAMLVDMLQKRGAYTAQDGADFLDATANARLVKNAEAYYRAMYNGAAESWNLRDTHMFETLCALLESGGRDSKAVIWAHNSHIGDARYTEMGMIREELNLGQLCRERFGAEAALIGFGTHSGKVACATDWDEPMEVKQVNPSRPDSYERLAHDCGYPRFLLDLREGRHDELREKLLESRLERFIGVIYRPNTERWSHYSECILPRQFDAYVWFDQTSAVTPLAGRQEPDTPDTWPFGF